MSIADTHMISMHLALDGLARRSEVRSNNVANAETPNFRAKGVDFESTLADVLARGVGDRRSLRPGDVATVVDRGGFGDLHGNTVDMETEMVEMMTDELLVASMVDSYSAKVSRLRTALGRS